MLALAVLPLAAALVLKPADPRIRVNTVGFLPDAPKAATIAAPCTTFQVVRVADGAVIYSGRAAAPVHTPASETDEVVQTADFTSVTQPGQYRLVVAAVGESQPFVVDAAVWNEPFAVASRAMYLWRCGTAVQTTWRGQTFRHDACHLDDGWLDYAGGGHTRRASVGGWHDAGDYNKYPVNAGVTIGLLLKAWEQFGDRIAKTRAGIPESTNGVPDLLDEVRWEVEWLFTMQQPDGRVFHKLSARDFRYWGLPEKEHEFRYFAPWSTTATADFVAIMAETARAWRKYDAAFAERCLTAAKLGWTCLLAHPQPVAPDLSKFQTGTYTAKDETHRLWAAAELWESTGEPGYRRDFEARAAKLSVTEQGPTWPDVRDLAFGTYLLSARQSERSADLVRRLTGQFVAAAHAAATIAQRNAYGRPLGGERKSWYWGCNGTVAGQTFILQVADRLQPDPSYRAAAQDALGFLFGRNFNGRSYVTGLGANPPAHPHDRRGSPAWPGYLVGGGWPTGRDYKDVQANYRGNEIAINWNGALIYALAGFVNPAGLSDDAGAATALASGK